MTADETESIPPLTDEDQNAFGGALEKTVADVIVNSARDRLDAQIDFIPRGSGCWFVETPFAFADGDHYVILLKEQNDAWRLTDEGHTLMHLSYWIDEKTLRQGTRGRLIRDALVEHGMEEADGELFIRLETDRIADGLFNFIQTLLKITDDPHLSSERGQPLKVRTAAARGNGAVHRGTQVRAQRSGARLKEIET